MVIQKFQKGEFVRIIGFSQYYIGTINRYESNHIVVDILNHKVSDFTNQFLLQECHLKKLTDKEKLFWILKLND